jgi:ribosomal protein L23
MPLHSIKAVTSDSRYVAQVKPDSTRYDIGKAIKYNFAFCTEGNAGGKETFDQF